MGAPTTPGGAQVTMASASTFSTPDNTLRASPSAMVMARSQSDPLASPGMKTSVAGGLPRLHYFCYRGDVVGVLSCVTQGCAVNETAKLRNQNNKYVNGITPLFLAAQRGHLKICRILVENGANPNQPCYLDGTADLCTPAEVAKLNLHFRCASYLRKAIAHRKQEDEVLAVDEAEQEQAVARETKASPAGKFMKVMDLLRWDPKRDDQPQADLNGKKVTRLMKKNKIDLMTWQPDADSSDNHGHAGHGGAAGGSGGGGGEGSLEARSLPPSHSLTTSKFVKQMDLEAWDPTREDDHSKVLNRFLRDLDLAAWSPDAEGCRAMGPMDSLSNINSRAVSRGASRGGSKAPSVSGGSRQPSPGRPR